MTLWSRFGRNNPNTSSDVEVAEGSPDAPQEAPIDASVDKDASAQAKDYRGSTFGHEIHHDRDRWPSRIAFYMAAIGSAVGFGK